MQGENCIEFKVTLTDVYKGVIFKRPFSVNPSQQFQWQDEIIDFEQAMCSVF